MVETYTWHVVKGQAQQLAARAHHLINAQHLFPYQTQKQTWIWRTSVSVFMRELSIYDRHQCKLNRAGLGVVNCLGRSSVGKNSEIGFELEQKF